MLGLDLAVGGGSLLERQFFSEGDEAEQFGRILLHSRQVHFGEVGGGDGARAHQRRQFGHRQKCELLEIRWGFRAGGFRDGGLEALRALDGRAAGQARMERE